MNDLSVIRLSGKRGGFTIVDNADFPYLNQWRWQQTPKGYIRRCEKRNGVVRAIYMHREIMGALPGDEVDHEDGCRHDNRRRNLRFCTPSQSSANTSCHHDAGTPFKGVSWHKASGKWMAQMCGDGTRHYLGLFTNPEAAAAAYNDAAQKQWGEYARLNSV